jgi:FAD/FMN-containing dehydrogenase
LELLQHVAALVRGDFHTDEPTRRRFSVDGSIFEMLPAAVLAPRDAGDIQAVAHLLWTQARAGRPVPSLTARGAGSDQAGGPLGTGIVLDMRRHMNQVLEVGPDFVRCQPGVRYGELQGLLKQHGRYLPPYPASLELCTIGGAVANNSSGEKTVKYGDTRDYVTSLTVVLASGDEVVLQELDALELAAKTHHYTLEGQLYREMQRILAAHPRAAEIPQFHVSKNSTGYAVWEVQERNKFNLAKLFVGSQGTLGIITEITLRTEALPTGTELIAAYFDSLDQAAEAVQQLAPLAPSALEIVDHNLLELVERQQPGHLHGLVSSPFPRIVLVIEFDDPTDRERSAKARAASSILKHYATEQRRAETVAEQERLWKLRRSAAAVMWTVKGARKAVPIVEDGIVPAVLLPEFFRRAYALFEKYDLQIAIWGHAGDANLHMQPFMDLSDSADRAKIWPFVEEFHALVIGMGGCISAEHNDGLLRSPYLKEQYGEELYGIFTRIKDAFDPYHFLNPMKKVRVSRASIEPLVRHSYSLDHLIADRELINR